MWQKTVLLRLIETVNLVYEQQSPFAVLAASCIPVPIKLVPLKRLRLKDQNMRKIKNL